MKITTARIQQIIREELSRSMREWPEDEGAGYEDEGEGFEMEPDDAMGGDEETALVGPVEDEIDWAQFEDDDADAVGAAFLESIKQLREENPDVAPAASEVVTRMQELLAADEGEDMGDEEMEDEGDMEDEAPMADEYAEEEGALNEWVRRTNLLAGTGKRR